MELWLDSTNLSAIEQVHKLGVLHGVTTNPSLAGSAGKTLYQISEITCSLVASKRRKSTIVKRVVFS